mmetsp:Transcript_29689/g.70069  ORF Transcript_29689/g.70069 Transcript_29689/m.70069 type:complete len:696 (+) Transcript_29689:83-2170(+)
MAAEVEQPSQATAAVGGPGAASLSADLAELSCCLDLGQISAEEFADLRRRVLEGFADRGRRCSCLRAGLQAGAAHCKDPSAVAGAEATSTGLGVPPLPLSSLNLRQASFEPHTGQQRHVCKPASARGCGPPPEIEIEAGHRESEADFWCKWIQRRTIANPPKSESKHCLTQATVHDIIDMTAGRLEEIFDRFDTNHDGELSHQELTVALESQGFHIDENGAAEIACHVAERSAEASARNHVTVGSFDTMMTRLRLAELFTPYAGLFQWSQNDGAVASPVLCCDYSQYVFQLHHNVAERPDFYFGYRRPLVEPLPTNDSREAGQIVRWVHMDASRGLDRLSLLRLAVKYHLHPLHVDDVIDNRTSSKFECTDKNYFIAADILRLSPTAAHGRDSGRVRIHRSHVSIFLSGSPDWDTLLTIHQERPDESSWLAMWRRKSQQAVPAPAGDVFGPLLGDLGQEPPRRMREAGADFLLYEVLDNIIVELRPLADAYAERLGFMYQGSSRRVQQAWLAELGEIELELTDLSRSIRPMRQLVRHLLGDERISINTKTHMEDADEAVAQLMDDLSQLQQMARYLQEASERQYDKKMNDTLFVLSLISAIFLPAQFITGLYGMNFEIGGSPSIPELTWETGYHWFWVWQGVALVTAVVVVYVVSSGCWPCIPWFPACWRRLSSLCSRSSRVHAAESTSETSTPS